MAAPKRPTHIVTNPSCYLRVNGKLQELEVGTQLTLDAKVGKRLVEKGFAEDLKEAKKTTVGEPEAEG